MKQLKQCLLTLILVYHTTLIAMEIKPVIVHHAFEKAGFNQNWKVPLATGEETQVVIMAISPQTSRNNETGVETYAFDQVILIIKGQAKIIMNKKEKFVQSGDLVFIPLGTTHNIINTKPKTPLKVMRIYSQKDMPDIIFKTQQEETLD